MTLALQQRNELRQALTSVAELLPAARRVQARPHLEVIDRLLPHGDPSTARDDKNRRISGAFRRRRESELFQLTNLKTDQLVTVIGWHNLLAVLDLPSEQTIRVRFSQGGDRFTLRREGFSTGLLVTRPLRFADEPAPPLRQPQKVLKAVHDV